MSKEKQLTIACTRTAVSVTPFAKKKAAKNAPLTAAYDAGVIQKQKFVIAKGIQCVKL